MGLPPVVLLHGMWSTADTLAPLRAALEARGYRVLAPTLPLHPAHSPAELEALGRLSLADYALYLEAVIARADFPAPPVLVGHSMGGLLAQILAARLPVRACVLLAPAPPRGVSVIRPRNAWATRKVLLTPGFWRKPQCLPAADADAVLFNGIEPARRGELRARLTPESGRVYAEIVFGALRRDAVALVAPERVRCPVLAVAGAEDRIIPRDVVRRVAARYPHAEYLELPGRGHWFFDEPGADEVFARLGSWLDLVCAVTAEDGAPRRAEPRAARAPAAAPIPC